MPSQKITPLLCASAACLLFAAGCANNVDTSAEHKNRNTTETVAASGEQGKTDADAPRDFVDDQRRLRMDRLEAEQDGRLAPAPQPATETAAVAKKEQRQMGQQLHAQSAADAYTLMEESLAPGRQAAGGAATMANIRPNASHAASLKQGLLAPQPRVAPPVASVEQNRENYHAPANNSIKQVGEDPVSTFSIDVDTASYANVRRMLENGRMPPAAAVRVEEFVNYFDYQYPQPTAEQPFAVLTEMGPSPWAEGKKLLHIGLQGLEIDAGERPASNLVFLVDVSGSMNQPNKLPLLQKSMAMLVRQMQAEDKVSIVVYAGAAGVVLEPSSNRGDILDALQRLRAGGSTNGGAGIQAAYRMAEKGFIDGGVNRVVLCTDGDFNVGSTSRDALKRLIEQKRESGISLSVLGFGSGNYNDALMQTLAQNGNGNAFYIDSLQEARKVLVEEMQSTLQTIAKDVKIQIEFNPSVVSEYRLLGYETRHLRREDFNNDRIDAGEIGAGHTVTALYELSLVGDGSAAVDPLRYGAAAETTTNRGETAYNDELAFLRLRYKAPRGTRSTLIEAPVQRTAIAERIAATSEDFRFSAAVAAFAQKLRGDSYVAGYGAQAIIDLAEAGKGRDRHGYRSEFIRLAKLADSLGALATLESQDSQQEQLVQR